MDPLTEKFLLIGVLSLIGAVGGYAIKDFQTTQLSLSDLEKEMVALRLNTSHSISDMDKKIDAYHAEMEEKIAKNHAEMEEKIDKNHAEMEEKIDTVLAVVKAKKRPWVR